jgi:hypothetical protein
LEKASSAHIKARGKKDGWEEREIQGALKTAATQIEYTRQFYARTPAFQRAAEIWLKERKFRTNRRTETDNENSDRAAFKDLFESLR